MGSNNERSRLGASPRDVFARRMQELRQAKGISQHALVRRVRALGVPANQAGISRIEAGTQGVSLDEAVAIAAVLGVLPEELYREQLPWEEYVAAQAELGPGERLTPDEAWLKAWTTTRARETRDDDGGSRRD